MTQSETVLSNKQYLLRKNLQRQRAEVAQDISDDKFFEYFCTKNILFDFNLNVEDIIEGIIDGRGDGGIDGFFVFHNDEVINSEYKYKAKRDNHIDVIIIQSKNTKSFKEDAILKLKEAATLIFDFSKNRRDLVKRFRTDIVEKIIAFREVYEEAMSTRHSINIDIYYCANAAEPHENLIFIAREIERICSDFSNRAKARFNFMGAEELHDLTQSNQGSARLTLELAEAPVAPAGGGYIALTTIENYYSFITNGLSHLNVGIFDANVRDYEGSNEVNDAIKSSLSTPGREDFWWLNNGVSIIADSITYSGKKLVMDAPQIVNGLQTSFEVYKYLSQNPSVNSGLHLLIRAIEISEDEKASRDKIIRATNSQTKIPSASLRATDKVHRDIEEYFKEFDLYYDRRKKYYINQNVPVDKIISITYLAQAYTAICLARPSEARAHYKELLQVESSYRQVFENKPLPAYKNSVLVMKLVEKYLSDKKYTRGISNIKFHMAYMLIAMLSGATKPSEAFICNLNLAELDISALDSAFNDVSTIFSAKAKRNFEAEAFSRSKEFETDCKNIINVKYRKYSKVIS